MAYYISQGRAKTPIRRGGQFCDSFVVNLLQYMSAKNIEIECSLMKLLHKRVQYFASQCSSAIRFYTAEVTTDSVTAKYTRSAQLKRIEKDASATPCIILMFDLWFQKFKVGSSAWGPICLKIPVIFVEIRHILAS